MTTVQRPLRIFLPTALTVVGQVEQPTLPPLREERLQERANVQRVSRRGVFISDRRYLIFIARFF